MNYKESFEKSFAVARGFETGFVSAIGEAEKIKSNADLSAEAKTRKIAALVAEVETARQAARNKIGELLGGVVLDDEAAADEPCDLGQMKSLMAFLAAAGKKAEVSLVKKQAAPFMQNVNGVAALRAVAENAGCSPAVVSLFDHALSAGTCAYDAFDGLETVLEGGGTLGAAFDRISADCATCGIQLEAPADPTDEVMQRFCQSVVFGGTGSGLIKQFQNRPHSFRWMLDPFVDDLRSRQ